MKRIIVTIPMHNLAEVIGLPPDIDALGVAYEASRHQLRVVIEGDALPYGCESASHDKSIDVDLQHFRAMLNPVEV